MKSRKEVSCPCGTEKQYSSCCQPFHNGILPQHALQLMRSRYSAYALSLGEYIIMTTHPANSQFCQNREKWLEEITLFCAETVFKGLTILDNQEKGSVATVTFTASLFQQSQDVSFTEKSSFEKVEGKWLYFRGEIL